MALGDGEPIVRAVPLVSLSLGMITACPCACRFLIVQALGQLRASPLGSPIRHSASFAPMAPLAPGRSAAWPRGAFAESRRALAHQRSASDPYGGPRMTSSDSEKSQIRYARLAGFMYLLVDAAYLTFVVITTRFRVSGDFDQTARRITESELLYRIGASSGLVASLSIVFLAIGLFVATKPLNSHLALLALSFRLLEATLVGGQAVLGLVVLRLYTSGDSLNGLAGTRLSMCVTLHSTADQVLFNSLGIFFGIGSTLFFYLLFRSTYIPKLLAGLGLLGSVLVPISCFGSLLFPHHANALQLGWAPIGLAEIVVGLWLIVRGVNLQVSTPARPFPK